MPAAARRLTGEGLRASRGAARLSAAAVGQRAEPHPRRERVASGLVSPRGLRRQSFPNTKFVTVPTRAPGGEKGPCGVCTPVHLLDRAARAGRFGARPGAARHTRARRPSVAGAEARPSARGQRVGAGCGRCGAMPCRAAGSRGLREPGAVPQPVPLRRTSGSPGSESSTRAREGDILRSREKTAGCLQAARRRGLAFSSPGTPYASAL